MNAQSVSTMQEAAGGPAHGAARRLQREQRCCRGKAQSSGHGQHTQARLVQQQSKQGAAACATRAGTDSTPVRSP